MLIGDYLSSALFVVLFVGCIWAMKAGADREREQERRDERE